MAGWRESLRKRTGMNTVEIILQFSLRGRRKKGWGVGGGGEKRESGQKESESLPLSPQSPSLFPSSLSPNPFGASTQANYSLPQFNSLCRVCENFEGWKLLLLYFLWTVFLVVFLTMGTFNWWRPFDRLLYSFLRFLQTVVYQPMVLIGCAGLLGTIIAIPSRSVTKWLSWDKG